MELKWLEDFLVLSSTGSFSKAAAQRHVTQPAFGRRIRALEQWVGMPLVDRSAYPTRLTPEGELFRVTVAAVVSDLKRARDELRAQADMDKSVLRFAALHTLALTFFPKWIASVEAVVGTVRSRLTAENMHDCVELLSMGNCDFLLSYAHPGIPVVIDETRFTSVVLGEETLVAVVAAREGNPLYTLPGSPDSPVPYLRYSSDTLLGKVVSGILADSGTRTFLDPVYENSMAEALRAMALLGKGFAWLPYRSVREDIEQGRLCSAGNGTWQADMEIRIYRPIQRARDSVERFWAHVA